MMMLYIIIPKQLHTITHRQLYVITPKQLYIIIIIIAGGMFCLTFERERASERRLAIPRTR